MEKGVISGLLVTAGVSAEQAATDAFNVIAIETRTAELKQTREEGRASVGKYVTREELKAMEPAFYWDDFFAALSLDDVGMEGGSPIVLHDDQFFAHGLTSLLENPNPQMAHLASLAGASGTQGLEYVAFDRSKGDRSFDPEDAQVLQSYLRYTIVSTFVPFLPEAEFADVKPRPPPLCREPASVLALPQAH